MWLGSKGSIWNILKTAVFFKKNLKPLTAGFCLNEHLDTSLFMVWGVIWVRLTHFTGRAVFLGTNFETFKWMFLLEWTLGCIRNTVFWGQQTYYITDNSQGRFRPGAVFVLGPFSSWGRFRPGAVFVLGPFSSWGRFRSEAFFVDLKKGGCELVADWLSTSPYLIR